MITTTRAGIFIFALVVLLGPLYTVQKYSFVSNLISELGAQHTPNNFIMISAFIALGGGIAFDGIKRFRKPILPFILYGLSMALVGIFPHKPIDATINYNALYHDLHGINASIAGTLMTIGLLWQGFVMNGLHRIICFYMAGVSIIFPIFMLSFPNYQGIIQRVIYFQILGWVWFKYQDVLANQSLSLTPKIRRT